MHDIAIQGAADLINTVDLVISAILVIDTQNDFCHQDGACQRSGLDMTPFREMADRLNEFITQGREARVTVIHIGQVYTPWTLSPAYMRRLKMYSNIDPYKTLQPGSWGAGFYKIVPQNNECIIMKSRDSAFFDTNLDQILRCSQVRTIILTGMATSGCVEATAKDGFFRDYHVVVLEDCTADGLERVHESALRRMALIGVVTSSQTVLQAWEKIGNTTEH